VLSITSGSKISLSMKDVDQETGEDLNPTGNNRVPGGTREADLNLRNPERPLDFLGENHEAVVLDDDDYRYLEFIQTYAIGITAHIACLEKYLHQTPPTRSE